MATFYDVALANDQQFFSSRIREFCAQFELSFFLIEPTWAFDFLSKLEEREIGVRVLIDMSADAYDIENIYFKIAKEVAEQGGYVINDPDLSAAASHKGLFHHTLANNSVLVPPTVIVPRKDIDTFRLTREITNQIGTPFVVKPGWGGGRIGVILDATSEDDILRSAKEAIDSDSFLLQRRLTPKQLDSHVAWFRVFYVFGEVIPCWWEPPANQYQLVTPLQRKTYHLSALARMAREIARLSKVEFFSTEITLADDGKFYAVDYLNTDCDMRVKSFWPTGVPDEVVRHIAWILVEQARDRVHRSRGVFDHELLIKDPPQKRPARPRRIKD